MEIAESWFDERCAGSREKNPAVRHIYSKPSGIPSISRMEISSPIALWTILGN